MPFDKQKYWLNRMAENEFRSQWYEWRAKAIEMYGKTFVYTNRDGFTQRAFRTFLDMVIQKEQEESLQQLTAHELTIPALNPELTIPTVSITDIDPPQQGTVIDLT